MITAGRSYVRRRRPHTVVTVISRTWSRVTYQLKDTQMTISVAAFKDIYERNRRCSKRK